MMTGQIHTHSPLKRYRGLMIAALVVVVFGAMIWSIFRNPYGAEPNFQNEPLTVWLERFDRMQSIPLSVSEDPRRAVRRMGTNIIPYLVSNLRHRDPVAKTWILTTARNLHLYRGRYVPDDVRYNRAGMALMALGPDAAGAVPDLAIIYENNQSAAAKISIGRVFARIGPAAAEAVPALVRGAAHPQSTVRYEAVVALGAIHANPEQSVPALTSLFNDPSSPIRLAAIDSLGRFGSNARPALPALLNFMQSPTTTTQSLNSWLVVLTNVQRIDAEAAEKLMSNAPTPPDQSPYKLR